MRGAVEASVEEGWVDILDLSSANLPVINMEQSNIDQEKVELDEVETETTIPTKRLYGKIDFLCYKKE